ncbi:MAG: nitroreductase family protein [Parasporobacterium sp.]|nr:nitroreductase family protein [Parasporobacterium sp.]
MEFEKLIHMRQSTRKYQDTQITEEQLARIIDAANRAPVGSNLYKDVHLTVVQNQDILLKLCEAAWQRFSKRQNVEEIAGDTIDKNEIKTGAQKPNLFYGAPTVIFVSHRKQDLQPGIEWANVTSVVNQMHLAATDLGLGSVYMWGALESMRMIPELDHTDLLQLPEDFEPLIALALGYPEEPLEERTMKHPQFGVNRI